MKAREELHVLQFYMSIRIVMSHQQAMHVSQHQSTCEAYTVKFIACNVPRCGSAMGNQVIHS